MEYKSEFYEIFWKWAIIGEAFGVSERLPESEEYLKRNKVPATGKNWMNDLDINELVLRTENKSDILSHSPNCLTVIEKNGGCP